MKKLLNLFTLQELKGLLLKVIFPSIGKVVAIFGLGLIGVSFWETLANSIAEYLGVPFEYTNNPLWGTILVVIGLIYELIYKYLDNKRIQDKIDTSIKRIEKDFSEGRFQQSIEDLNSYLKEYEKNEEATYQLLVSKTKFLLELKKLDEFKELIELIESEYKNKINTKFKELKITLLAFEQDESFFEESKNLRIKTPNSKPQGHFDIVYYLNAGDNEKAKELFEVEIKNKEYRKHLLLIGGHIYSNLYQYDEEDTTYFELADKYYKEALKSEDEISFMEKVHIYGFYGTIYVNNGLRHKKQNIDIKYLEEYKSLLDIVFENKKYFDVGYINSLLENYTHSLLALGSIEEYKKIYEEYKELLSVRFYLEYCEVTNIAFEHEKVQAYIKKDFNINDLVIYVSFVNNKNIEDTNCIISFLDDNRKLINDNDFVIYCYVKGSIQLNKKIDDKIVDFLKENKYQSIDLLLSFLEWQRYNKQQLESIDLENLFDFINQENNFVPRIIDAIIFLQHIGNRSYLKIALDKQNIFEELIYEALKLCSTDRDLNYNQFNAFVEDIKNKDKVYWQIAQICQNFNKLDKAFDFYYLQYEKNKDINVMFSILHISLVLYMQSGEKYESKKQDEIFSNLLTKVDDLEFQNLLFILSYEISVRKDSKDILHIINQRLLNTDINTFSQEIKIGLSNFYLQTQFTFPNYTKIFLADKNLCYEKDGLAYVDNKYSIVEENQKNYGFRSISSDKSYIISQDESYNKISLFHRIVGPFAFKVDNPNLVTFQMDESKEDPLEDMMSFIKGQSSNARNLFERYSDGKEIGFHPLSQSSYRNYFTLIPYLLEHKEFNFNAGEINYKLPEINKILTLSSIVFLYDLNLLEQVLEREDVFIQRSMLNWLKEYSSNITFGHMPTNFSYLDEMDQKPTLYVDTQEDIDSFKEKTFNLLALLVDKCENKIIEDHLEILPIKYSFEMLSKHIGNQEYQVFAYCINHNFQIITEDSIFNMLFDVMKFNKTFISNSLILIEDIMSDEDLRALKIDLSKKNYSKVLDLFYMKNLFEYMRKNDISMLQPEEIELIRIVDQYGWLEDIKKYYNNKFSGKYIKTNLPTPNLLDINIENLLKVL
ncbi:hypothetical protein [Malaciobacter marinus]|uniref:hypothetical protein n=1 Tax=Malaciobacter marinus TaxID=505249 RepID=UPI003B00B1BE